MDTGNKNDEFVRAFARGLQIIQAMGTPPREQTISEISEKAQLPRTVVRRLVMTLVALGFADRKNNLYRLTPRVLQLGMAYLYTLPFWRQSGVLLEELSNKISQSCAIAVLDGDDIVYTQRFHAKKILMNNPVIGTRIPAYSVSMGKVLLAELPKEELDAYLARVELTPLTKYTTTDINSLREELKTVRSQGYAWGDREYNEAICGLAVPIKNHNKEVMAAINVSLYAGEFSEEKAIKELLPLLKLTANNLQSAS